MNSIFLFRYFFLYFSLDQFSEVVKAYKILKYALILSALTIITCCAPSRKNTYYQKKRKASHVNTEQLGRNRYFFSPQYQRKLTSNYKRKR